MKRRLPATKRIAARFPLAALLPLLGVVIALGPVRAQAAEDREALVREDRKIAEEGGPWIYNDLERGVALARESHKPLLVVFRCPP